MPQSTLKTQSELKGLFQDETVKGIVRSDFDFSVNPKTDFYLFANGGWMNNNPLPDDYSRYGIFDQVNEQSIRQRKELIDSLSENPEADVSGSNAQKVRDIFRLGMDVDRLNADGIKPLRPFIDRILSSDLTKLEQLVAWLHLGITSTFFSAGIGPDQRDSSKYLLNISYPGLGLGDRDYYLEQNEESDRFLKGYQTYIKRIMQLSGFNATEQDRIWRNVLEIETKFAQHRRTKEEMRNPLLFFNVMKYEDFKKRYNNFDWDIYLKQFGVDQIEEVNVIDPDFLDFINNYIPTLNVNQIKDLFLFDLISDSTSLLGEEFEEASFDLYGKIMRGVEERQPRWKRIMSMVNSMFGEVVGKLYVEKFFPVGHKNYMLGLVDNLKTSLAKHIEELEWMSDETKEKALGKLASLNVKIGYPDVWKDYSGIIIDPEKSYQENVYHASVWFTKDNFAKINKNVDKNEWFMNPQAVNAYYNPTANEICFPAGILQPPFFDPDFDPAVNYARIGVIIGHEMTHGFDDSGRHYDKDGNLAEWWIPQDTEKFNILSDALAAQFDKVEVQPGLFANGRYTLGENIADQGGIRIALDAYREFHKNDSSLKGKEIDLRKFFLSYANVWAENIRAESIPVKIKTDSHSIGRLRVNETLKNIDEFFNAFGIDVDDTMYRPKEDRVTIW